MTTMNISIPEKLKAFVEQQVAERGFGSASEYVRELIRRDQQRAQLRELMLEGARSEPAGVADSGYFEALREQVRHRARR